MAGGSRFFLYMLVFLSSAGLYAQDNIFTQQFAFPIKMNPALTGAYDGKYRVATVYRDQWSSIAENPYKAFGVGLDLRFQLNENKGYSKDAFAFGIVFQSDKAGPLDFSNNQLNITGAFHKALDGIGLHVLSGGIDFGIVQRNLNFEDIYFQDQFNGELDFIYPTLEDLPINNFVFGDLSTGIHYSYNEKKLGGFLLGGSINHIFTPQVSFYKKDPNASIQQLSDSRLNRRYTAYLGGWKPLSEGLTLHPRAMISLQGQSFLGMLGTAIKLEINNYNDAAMHLGTYVRMNRDIKKLAFESIVGVLGFEYSSFAVGLSLDFNISGQQQFKRNQNAMEISISYFGAYENENDMCPKF